MELLLIGRELCAELLEVGIGGGGAIGRESGIVFVSPGGILIEAGIGGCGRGIIGIAEIAGIASSPDHISHGGERIEPCGPLACVMLFALPVGI